MKKKLLFYFSMLAICALSYGGTVNYYDGYGGYINRQLDNTYVGNDPIIASWADFSTIWFSGVTQGNGGIDPFDAIADIETDANASGYYGNDVAAAESCIESAIDNIYYSYEYTCLLEYVGFYDDDDGDALIYFENDPNYWPYDITWAAGGGPEESLYITDGIIVINAIPSFLSSYTWDFSENSASNNSNDVVYLMRTAMHEAYHCLGIHHIFGHGSTPVMYEDGFPGSSWWVSDVSSYDILALNKLYDPYTTTEVNNIEVNNLAINLSSNYPNPFNPSTTISYSLSSPKEVARRLKRAFNPSTTISYSLSDNIQNPQIEIYNVKGQKVKIYQLVEKAGRNSIVWNGKDENEKSISSGVYFYRLVNEGKTVQSRKMLMLK